MQFPESGPWAVEQFGAAQLGDRRLTRRLVSYAAAAAASPSASIPLQCGTWKQAKGAYRLFDNDATTHEAVIRPHLESSRAAAARGRGWCCTSATPPR
jgi:Transposase DNA-binding